METSFLPDSSVSLIFVENDGVEVGAGEKCALGHSPLVGLFHVEIVA